MLHDLSQSPGISHDILAQLRNVELQSDRARFRMNLTRMGECMGYEIAKTLSYRLGVVQTPLGKASVNQLAERPVLGTILRAGLPMHSGLSRVFDQSDHAFVSACREYEDESHEHFSIGIGAVSSPSLENRTLILADPMLATGASLAQVLELLIERFGMPSEIHIAAIIASAEGVQKMLSVMPSHGHLWVGEVDAVLTDQGYIHPGLGDAGDLAFGSKMN
jgi:uracil phosphoribosyltransferase|tara:strand:+ start:12716 stop:13375 length:660 start_codon:yes stop_codon:yes gene_type:complete